MLVTWRSSPIWVWVRDTKSKWSPRHNFYLAAKIRLFDIAISADFSVSADFCVFCGFFIFLRIFDLWGFPPLERLGLLGRGFKGGFCCCCCWCAESVRKVCGKCAENVKLCGKCAESVQNICGKYAENVKLWENCGESVRKVCGKCAESKQKM